MQCLLCCSIKERAEPFARDAHTDIDIGTDSKDKSEAGTDSDSYDRQMGKTEVTGGRGRTESSDLGPLHLTAPRKVFYNFFFLM